MVVSLYAAYLLVFRLYKLDYHGNMDENVVFPRVVYVLAFGISLLPMLNLFCVIMFLVFLALWHNDYAVKSWLFEKPKQKEK